MTIGPLRSPLPAIAGALALLAGARAQGLVPTEIQQPGTQPLQVAVLESPNRCDNCHGGYDPAVEPARNWRGSMMANATRDPIFWATVAVAEQDFPGSGDLCIRCHTPEGWLAGHSTPTDGSGLLASETDGVSCDVCHKITNPDDSELVGTQFPPFVANDGLGNGYYGGGMYSFWGGNEKLGPYANPAAPHSFLQSSFHRKAELCGTCHDVSNPAVGDLAPGNGAQHPLAVGTCSGVLGSPVDGKAAFNNFPFAYGMVERTFSEHKAGRLGTTPVSQFSSLPADLQTGAIRAAWQSATVAGTGGNYADGTTRTFSCQTCHMRPVTGKGCNKNNAPIRADVPLHDMTGGNYWMPDVLLYMDSRGKLVLGGTLTSEQVTAIQASKARVHKQLSEAASLTVAGDTVKVVNLTGHKLLSGYPEGRRMWLRTRWYGSNNALLREDGAYGPKSVTIDGAPAVVDTILDLDDPNTRIYEAHYAITQEWAAALVALTPAAAGLVIAYDRTSGTATYTLGQLAAQASGTYRETFHFVLNNHLAKDNRIPTYGTSYDESKRRNTLPVPETLYGNPGPGGTYDYFDVIQLSPPNGAAYATLELLYQPTSWEYVQFLYLANNRTNAFLGQEGVNLLDAWRNTGMAAPYVMATATWGSLPASDLRVASLTTWSVSNSGALVTPTNTIRRGNSIGMLPTVVDHATSTPLSGVQLFVEVRTPSGALATSLQAFTDANGQAVLRWKAPKNAVLGTYTIRIVDAIKSGYTFNTGIGTVSVTFTVTA